MQDTYNVSKRYVLTRGALGEILPRPKGHTEPAGGVMGGLLEGHCSMLNTVRQK